MLVSGLAGFLSVAACAADNGNVVVSFDGTSLPANLVQNSARAELCEWQGRHALRVHYGKVDWPNVTFKAPDGMWDWSRYGGIEFDIYSAGDAVTAVNTRIDSIDRDGHEVGTGIRATAFPGQWTTHRTYLSSDSWKEFWGMNGLPAKGEINHIPASFDPSRIKAFQIFIPLAEREYTMIISNVRLFEKEPPLSEQVSMPFVDKFGQYKHDTWPGKLYSDEELIARRDQEEKRLISTQLYSDRDRFGGWAGGPQLKATGWFRTENVDGKWWLVDPEGHLFFSVGIDCVSPQEFTFIDKRESWYDWLPDQDSEYKPCFSSFSGSNVAAPIGGSGRTFSFYRANLVRKYGKDWETRWQEDNIRRLLSWGVNTIANWSDTNLMARSKVPFVVAAAIYGDMPRTNGFCDVFSSQFAEAVDKSIAGASERFASNEFCIGCYVDNELDWSPALGGRVLSNPVDQPARIAFIDDLKAKYGSIQALNKAWGTKAESWDALRPNGKGRSCAADIDAFTYKFAARYFQTIKDAIRKHAPNQLYLGCRFSIPPRTVVRACADIVDVVSYNLYYDSIVKESWVGKNDLGKPVMVGEFHYGATDHGLPHCGLVAAKNQIDRARSFARYVRSVAECPAFVGCHWFQYVDESLTSRWDGENYGVGFVDVTDTPYPEMVVAAQRVSKDIYRWHSGSSCETVGE